MLPSICVEKNSSMSRRSCFATRQGQLSLLSHLPGGGNPGLTRMSSFVTKLIATPLRPNLERKLVSERSTNFEPRARAHLPDRPMRWM